MTKHEPLIDNEIFIYNLKQIVESLKKAEKLTGFLKSCNSSKTNIMRWIRIGKRPRETSIKPICDKLGISIYDICFRKLKISLSQKIEVKFEEEDENALYYNINQIYECLSKKRKYKEIMKELKMGRHTIYTWKYHEKTPKKQTIKKLCDKFGIDMYDIYFKKLNIKIIDKIEVKFENNKEDK